MYSIDENGVNIPTLNEIQENLENQYKSIYGNDIDLSQNTPDGQLINIKAQNQADLNEAIIYEINGFNMNTAQGQQVDRNVAFRGIKRRAGTYTQQPIEITINNNCSLVGLDNNYNDVVANVFTVSDNNGNQYYLINSINLTSGTYTLNFRSQQIGNIQPALNSITNINTPVVGVVNVNNSSASIQIGQNEESDNELKTRFYNVPAIGGVGAWENIISNIYNINGVVSVGGEENTTNTTSQAGTPPHSIWLIVQGGANNEIGQAIKSTLNSGCGMRGNVAVPIVDKWGNTKNYLFDRPQFEDLYIKFDIQPLNTSAVYDETFIKTQLIADLQLKLNSQININEIGCILNNINSNFVYSNIQLSKDNINFSDFISNTNLDYIFTLEQNNININYIG